jgi:hypothetical protein
MLKIRYCCTPSLLIIYYKQLRFYQPGHLAFIRSYVACDDFWLGRFICEVLKLGCFIAWNILKLGTFCIWDACFIARKLRLGMFCSWYILRLETFRLGTFRRCTYYIFMVRSKAVTVSKMAGGRVRADS